MSILDRFTVTDHVAVVTGAGRGIGAATAVALAEAGADVVLSSRTESQSRRSPSGSGPPGGGRSSYRPTWRTRGRRGLAQAAYDEFGRLDIVVNNVGGTIPNAFLDTDVAYLDESFHFNVGTAHALTRAAVPLMLASGRARGPGRSRRDHQLDDGAVRRSGLPRLRHRKGRARALDRLAATDLAPQIRVNGIYVGRS